MQPFIRTLDRVRELAADGGAHADSLRDDLAQLDADFRIFRIQLFNEFKKYVIANFAFAAVLVVVLIVISYKADDPLDATWAVIFTALSILPAVVTLGTLWLDASQQLKPLTARANALEDRALRRTA